MHEWQPPRIRCLVVSAAHVFTCAFDLPNGVTVLIVALCCANMIKIPPNTNLDRLGKTDRYLQLRSFAFWWLASNLTNVPLSMKCHINNRKSKASLTQTWIALRKPARYLQLRSFTFFGTTWSLLSTILNPASWWLSQSFDSYAAAFCCTDVGPNCTGNSGILVSGKIRMAPKPSKTTTAWWLASNLTDVPVAMKCQPTIN